MGETVYWKRICQGIITEDNRNRTFHCSKYRFIICSFLFKSRSSYFHSYSLLTALSFSTPILVIYFSPNQIMEHPNNTIFILIYDIVNYVCIRENNSLNKRFSSRTWKKRNQSERVGRIDNSERIYRRVEELETQIVFWGKWVH